MDRFLAERLRIEPGDRILDAGCGVGASALWLAGNYGVEVIGITLSEVQCTKANAFAEREGLSDRIRFYVMDFTATDFREDSFDIILGLESVCYAEDKTSFIKEAYRILREGGRLAVADGFLRKQSLNRVDRFCLNNWIEGWAVPNLAQVDMFHNGLKEMGFGNTEFTDITEAILPSSREIFRRGVLGWPVYGLKRRSPVRMNHVKGCIFQYLALKRGIWSYGVFYGEKQRNLRTNNTAWE